jgi:signal transduction histidine kinase
MNLPVLSGGVTQRRADPSVRPKGVNPSRPKPHGVGNHVLTRAIRRVEAALRAAYGTATDIADIAPILAASALAADRGDASCLDELTPPPSLRLCLHLIDRLEDEVLELEQTGETTPAHLLDVIKRLRRVRAGVERRFQQVPGAPLAGIDGLEFLIEFVHDLKSPLSSLQLLADRLQQGWSGPLTELQQRQLRLIYAATHALNNVTSNALQLTREWDQLDEPEPRPFSVTRLLSEVQEIVRTLAVQKGLEINFVRPSLDRRLGHPIELQRILLNLVTNALKFTRAGSVTVTAIDRDDNRMEFAVQDTGPGIDSAVQETLFQPFRRFAGHAAFSATRLGLAITQRLVRALGGQLRYQTAPDQGTRFSFVLDLPVS